MKNVSPQDEEIMARMRQGMWRIVRWHFLIAIPLVFLLGLLAMLTGGAFPPHVTLLGNEINGWDDLGMALLGAIMVPAFALPVVLLVAFIVWGRKQSRKL